jgi:hypothetical protein
VPARVRGGRRGEPRGGILTYGTEQLLEEVSYVAYHFHWPLAEILDLEHPLRRQLIDRIGQINERMSTDYDDRD